MTALPLPPQRLPLTVAEYLALGEDPDGVRYELQEGNLVMSPKPVPEHQIAIMRLARQLDGRVSLTAHHLAGEFGTVTSRSGDPGPVAGVFTTTEPFPVRVDLDALV